jgi:hypothetical protein
MKLLATLSIYPLTVAAFAPARWLAQTDNSCRMSKLHMSVPNWFDTLTSGLASIARLPFGTIVASPSLPANVPRISALYDMEGNTDCRLVRERISELDLNVDTVIPAGENSRAAKDASHKYNDSVKSIPLMVVVDESGERIYAGRDDVLGFLTDEFGERNPIMEENEEELKKKIVEALVFLSEPLPSLLRIGRAQDVAGCARSSETPRPSKPLVSFWFNMDSLWKVLLTIGTYLPSYPLDYVFIRRQPIL